MIFFRTRMMNAVVTYVRNYLQPLNVYEAMRPMINTCSYMGLLPIRLTGKRPNRCYQVSRLGYINAVLHILLFIVSLMRSLRTASLFSSFFISDNITSLSELFQLITAFAAMGVVYAVCIAKRYCFVAIADMLHQIDQSLARLGMTQDFALMFRSICWNLFWTIVVVTVYIASCVVLVENSEHTVTVTTFVTYFFPHTVLGQIVFKYRMIMGQIIRRMISLNKVGRVQKYSKYILILMHFLNIDFRSLPNCTKTPIWSITARRRISFTRS